MIRVTQRQLLVIIAAVVFMLAGSQWLVRPYLERRQRLALRIERSELRLKEIRQLELTYRRVQSNHKEFEQYLRGRQRGFTLFAFLENLAGKDGLKGQIEFMRPSVKALGDMYQEEQVEMRLNGVTLSGLVPYLYHIETAPEKVRVKRMTIRPQQRNPSLLEVNLVLVTIGLRETARSSSAKGARHPQQPMGTRVLVRRSYEPRFGVATAA
jgi:general secretion pathway protein M